MSGCQMFRYSNDGPKNGLKKPGYGPKCLVFKWSAKSRDFTIWIPNTQTVLYSDESGIPVFDIQMVTVSQKYNFIKYTTFCNLCCSLQKSQHFVSSSIVKFDIFDIGKPYPLLSLQFLKIKSAKTLSYMVLLYLFPAF